MNDLGFVLDSIQDFDEGGIPGTAVFYRSGDCKVQIYKSSRQGSVNCMIAPLSACNDFGQRDSSSEWYFITKFTAAPAIPLEELVRLVSDEWPPVSELLAEVRDRIEQHYEVAHAGILEMYGGG